MAEEKIGTTWVETWEENDPMGEADFQVVRHHGETITLAYRSDPHENDDDDDEDQAPHENDDDDSEEDQFGWFVVDEENGSWEHLGSDKDRYTFLLEWLKSVPKKGKKRQTK